MARLNPGRIVGLVFGCVVVGVMLFMMFAVLGGLLTGGE
jgi:tetrahydromethanopterin S-methyltransferase subunit G